MLIDNTQYKMTKENLKIFNSLDEKITGTDIILLLLNVGRIKGKIEFQKQVFLAWKELFFKHSTDLGYIPHRYGAYSKSVEVSSRYLESEGLIKIIRRNGKGATYYITEYGKNEIHDRIVKLKINLSKVTSKKQDWDKWDKEGIMRYTYRNYPEYTSETKLSRFKW